MSVYTSALASLPTGVCVCRRSAGSVHCIVEQSTVRLTVCVCASPSTGRDVCRQAGEQGGMHERSSVCASDVVGCCPLSSAAAAALVRCWMLEKFALFAARLYWLPPPPPLSIAASSSVCLVCAWSAARTQCGRSCTLRSIVAHSIPRYPDLYRSLFRSLYRSTHPPILELDSESR